MADEIVGFKVTIEGPDGLSEDFDWEAWTGGGESTDVCHDASSDQATSQTFQTHAPGHKSVGEITLRGAMTDGRKALMDWINGCVSGKEWKRTLTITELLSVDGGVKAGKSYVYHDGCVIDYVFPRLSVTNTTGNVMEEVRLKFQRTELK